MLHNPKLKKTGWVLVITIPLLSVLYCAWGWLGARGPLYWPVRYPITCSWGIGMLVSLAVLLFALELTKIHSGYRVLLFLWTGLCICAGTLFAFYGKYHLDSAQLNGRVYHLAYYTQDNGQEVYVLYECEKTGTWCDRCSFYYVGETYVKPAKLIIDNAMNELRVSIDGKLIYTHGAQPRCHVEYCWADE